MARMETYSSLVPDGIRTPILSPASRGSDLVQQLGVTERRAAVVQGRGVGKPCGRVLQHINQGAGRRCRGSPGQLGPVDGNAVAGVPGRLVPATGSCAVPDDAGWLHAGTGIPEGDLLLSHLRIVPGQDEWKVSRAPGRSDSCRSGVCLLFTSPRGYGTRRTFPVVLRPSRSRCACPAWLSG